MHPWTNFAIVICAQAIVLLVLMYHEQADRTMTLHHVLKTLLVGMLYGVVFDLVFGKYLRIFDYSFHFNLVFLAINGALSYGIWLLTIQMLHAERLLHFLGYAMLTGLIYEVSNYFFPVWHWTFTGGFWYQEGVVVIAAYCGFALVTAQVAALTTRTPFRALGHRTAPRHA